jgi:hypothetical protein
MTIPSTTASVNDDHVPDGDDDREQLSACGPVREARPKAGTPPLAHQRSGLLPVPTVDAGEDRILGPATSGDAVMAGRDEMSHRPSMPTGPVTSQ